MDLVNRGSWTQTVDGVKKVCTLILSQYHQIKGTSKLNLGRGDQTGNSRQNESPGQKEGTHGSQVLWSPSATGASRPKPALCANQRMSSTTGGRAAHSEKTDLIIR